MRTSTLFIIVAGVASIIGWMYHQRPKAFTDFASALVSKDEASPSALPIAPIATTTPVVIVPKVEAPEPVLTPVAFKPVETPAPIIAPPTTKKVFVAPDPLPKQDNWTWIANDGKSYEKVRITKVEADAVTILDSDGGARIDISLLPTDIQQQLNYDPELAKEAAEYRQKSNQQNQALLAQEKQASDALLYKKQVSIAEDSERANAAHAFAESQVRDMANAEAHAEVVEEAKKEMDSILHPAIGYPRSDPYTVERLEKDRAIINGK